MSASAASASSSVNGAVVRVRVPATAANLGPGYDCAGMALALYDDLSAEVDKTGELSIEVEGEGAGRVALDSSHLVVRAITAGFAEAGRPLPGLRLKCHNRIPHGRGLGSSSVAIVGGLALARGLLADGYQLLTDSRLLRMATEIEGHPDNVAPALLGGFTLAWTDAAQGGRAVRLNPHTDLEPVVAIPRSPLATEQARQLLPALVPHAEAAANAARAALLTEAITHRPDLLLTASEDWLHQDYRRPAYPSSHALMVALRERRIPSMISGAGPTVIAFGVRGTTSTGPDVLATVEMLLVALGVPVRNEFTARQLGVDLAGVTQS